MPAPVGRARAGLGRGGASAVPLRPVLVEQHDTFHRTAPLIFTGEHLKACPDLIQAVAGMIDHRPNVNHAALNQFDGARVGV